MSATQLKSVPPRRTEARETLDEAIERHAAAQRQLTRLKTALDRAEAALYGEGGAMHAAERAEAALKEAKANESHHLAAVALGDATEDANPTKAAERAVAEAQSRLDTTSRTKGALKEQLKAAESELPYVKDALDKAVRAVFKSEAAAIVDTTLREAAALQEQLGAKRIVLRFFERSCFSSHERELAKPIEDFLAAPTYPWEFNRKRDEHPALEPWRAAHEALRQNADAPLPI
jgi:predicted  nucleic acid-binding Zn-ribbon protein